ncbi:MAG: hypothetical protein WC465_04530 [Patescibacteria group bacterium]
MNKGQLKNILSSDYQAENYDSLKFWQSYRTWAMIAMFISLAISAWVFTYDLWIVFYLLILYIFLAILIVRGYKWPLVAMMVVWLLEKYNNDGYLIIKFWSVPIFLLIGIILFWLLYVSFKIQVARRHNNGKSRKHYLVVLIGIALVLLLWYGLSWAKYYGFGQPKFNFVVQEQNNKTIIREEVFNIKFQIDAKCRLESDNLDRQATADLWSGQLWCQGYDDYVDFSVDQNIDSSHGQDKPIGTRAWLFDKPDEFWAIDVYDSQNKYRLLVGGYSNTDNIKNDLVSSLIQE